MYPTKTISTIIVKIFFAFFEKNVKWQFFIKLLISIHHKFIFLVEFLKNYFFISSVFLKRTKGFYINLCYAKNNKGTLFTLVGFY